MVKGYIKDNLNLRGTVIKEMLSYSFYEDKQIARVKFNTAIKTFPYLMNYKTLKYDNIIVININRELIVSLIK